MSFDENKDQEFKAEDSPPDFALSIEFFKISSK